MAPPPTVMQRWENYRPTKTFSFWFGASCAIATMVVGFGWGGWELGGKAEATRVEAVALARAELASAICVERFSGAADASAQLASLTATDVYRRDKYIQDGGWVTVAGTDVPVAGAAALCVRRLMDPARRPS